MITFVGAGCGAVDLITVRGRELLEKADVIIYAGSLVNPELLTYAKADCELYNSACMTLEEIFAVMEKAHEEHKEVVRLHTGEPSIYGAVREQMDHLEKKGIPYESCPGVSACFAARVIDLMKEDGYEHAETNLNLEYNAAIRNLWKRFDAVEHKLRRSYVKKL